MELFPQKLLKASSPLPVRVTLFGNRAIADDQIKVRSLGRTHFSLVCDLMKRGNLNTEADMGRKKTM